MIKKVLVVGGAGYIGGCVTDNLLKNKIPFTVYDNLTYESKYLKPVDFIFGDVRDYKKLKKILPLYSHIIWLVAITGESASEVNKKLTKDINQTSVFWISKNFPGKIIFTSTCAVYQENKDPVTEKSPTKPTSLYAKTKLEAEKYLRKNKALIFRLGTAYGLGDFYSRIRMDISVNYMSMSAVKDNQLIVKEKDKKRGFIHVHDIGKILVDNLNNTYNGIVNLTTENSTFKDLALMIQKETGCKITFKDSGTSYNHGYFVDIKKGLEMRIFTMEKMHKLIDGFNEIKNLVLSGKVKDFDDDLYFTDRYLNLILNKEEKSYSKS